MIVGNPTEFAIASEMTVAYERLSFRGLGSFTIFVGGFQYGVLDHHATMLACSFDEVERRIRNRGMHISPLGIETSSEAIATAVANVRRSGSKTLH